MEKTERHDAVALKAELFDSKGRPEPEEGFQKWIEITLDRVYGDIYFSTDDRAYKHAFKLYFGLCSDEPVEYNQLAERLGHPEVASAWYKCCFPGVVRRMLNVLHTCVEETADGFLERMKLGMSVDQLELSVRPWKAIHRVGIKTIGELIECPASRLREGGNFGVKSLKEINDLLQEMKLPCIQWI